MFVINATTKEGDKCVVLEVVESTLDISFYCGDPVPYGDPVSSRECP